MIDLARMEDDASVLLTAIYDAPSPHEQRGLVGKLRPSDDDYPRVFAASAVESARAAYESLWAQSPMMRAAGAGRGRTTLVVHAALAEDFGAPGSGRVSQFPGGYQRVAALLVPGIVWVCWKLVDADGAVSFNGLAHIEDHWAWFPKPWKAISPRTKVATSHWIE